MIKMKVPPLKPLDDYSEFLLLVAYGSQGKIISHVYCTENEFYVRFANDSDFVYNFSEEWLHMKEQYEKK